MKTALLLLTLLASCAHAIQLKDLAGSWSGQRKETLNGVGIQFRVTVDATSHLGELVVVVKGNSPIYGPYKSRQIYTKDGKFSEKITAMGFIVASGKGSWKIKSGAVQIAASGGNLGGKAKVKGVIQKVGENQIKYNGSSNGAKVSFNLRRK